MIDALTAALDYAELGWPGFPVGADKKPLTEHGLKDGTTDPDQLDAWWQRWPHAGVAIVTGKVSGVVVLDIDIDAEKGINGLDALEELGISAHPETLTNHTPRGGIHLLFKAPAFEVRNSAGKIGRGLDVRGSGGYVVMPPRRGGFWDPHLGLGTPLAPLPAWMMPKRDEVTEKRPGAGTTSRRREVRLTAYAEAALDGAVKAITSAVDGQRRTTLNREAYSIGRLAGSGAIPAGMALDVLTWAGQQIPAFADHDPDRIVSTAFMDGLRQPKEVLHG